MLALLGIPQQIKGFSAKSTACPGMNAIPGVRIDLPQGQAQPNQVCRAKIEVSAAL
jgi:hypothetical protein